MIESVLRGALGFGAVSVAAFLVWAFAGRGLARHLGEAGFYAVVAAAFLALSGALLHPLASGPRPFLRFTAAFVPAFAAYAAAWTACCFADRSTLGQALASLAGTAVLAAVAGGLLGGTAGKLGWGLLYGLGFGAGIGYAFFAFQRPRAEARP